MCHKKITLLAGFILIGVLISGLYPQQIVINEVMSNNISTLRDEDGDYPDWIELHNPGSIPVSLFNYGISDNPADPFRWTFPDIRLGTGEFLLLFASGKNKSALVIHLETIIDLGDEWKYFAGFSEPPSAWNSLTFNDSGWSAGPSGFGFGDDDDSTYVGPPTVFSPGPISIFIRKTFFVENINDVEGTVLHVDYDDAFVAYLNGQEVARSNIGAVGLRPPYDQFADSPHEAGLYRGLLPEKFILDGSGLREGENVLAIQVHNEQLFSSDLSLIPFLTLEMSAIPTNARGVAPLLQLEIPDLHTNFQISSTGETIVISNVSGAMQDSVETGFLPGDISRGRQPDGTADWFLFNQPTPGGSNNTPGFQNFSEPPQFSQPAGFYSGPLSIALSSAIPQAVIYYTLDGSTPTDSSQLYTGQILLDSTRVVRARTFAPGVLPGPTATRTYFINQTYPLPVVSLSTDPENFFDWNTGIYVMGPNASPDYPHFGANFWEDWEKPLHFELFGSNGLPEVSLDAGVKIFGSWSRLYPQKSLAIYARDRYGYPEISGQVFPGKPIHTFQALVLRNSGQDWGKTFFRDALTSALVAQTDVDVMAYRPALVFINGQLWGIHNIREKMNEHFLAANRGVDPDNIDFVERDTVILGDDIHYQALLHFVETQDMTLPVNFTYVREQMDVENFMDYILSVLFYANPDWPWNNVRCWRPRTPGGKWKWMLYDMDYTFHGGHLGPDANTFNEMYSQQNGTTLLFFTLLENSTFRFDFINRYADHLNTTFDSTRVLQVIQQLQSGIENAMPYHITRWQYSFVGPWWLGKSIDSMEEWYQNIAVARDFGQRRANYVRQHIVDYFQLYDGGIGTLNLDVSPSGLGFVRINHLLLDNLPWSGKYFPSVAVKLQAIPRPGYRFSHWEGVSVPAVPSVSVLFQDNQTITAVFEPDTMTTSPVVINEINYRSAANFDTEDWIEFYNSTGASLDISGWQFKDSDDAHVFVFPSGTVLPADGYIVLCRDTVAFRQFFPLVLNYVGEMNFGLSSSGEKVRIFDHLGNLVDSLTYGISPPWPYQPNGNGPTLALKNPFLDNSLPGSWAASGNHGTPGALNDVYIKIEDGGQLEIPEKFILYPNYPNPFNPETMITFSVPHRVHVTLVIYDVSGRKVITLIDRQVTPGTHSLKFNAKNLASGIYLYKLRAGDMTQTRKMVIIQ